MDITAELRNFSTHVRGKASTEKASTEKASTEKASTEKASTEVKPAVKKVTTKKANAGRKPQGESEPVPCNASPTIEDICKGVEAPMKVVLHNGAAQNINSGVHIECPRGHIHNYNLRDLTLKQPVCKTCSVAGALTKRIREQIEGIFGQPFSLVEANRRYVHYAIVRGCCTSLCTEGTLGISLYTVKSGQTVDREGIILPESQSREMVSELIYKQCSRLQLDPRIRTRVDELRPKKVERRDPILPYCAAFAGAEIKYKISPSANLLIEKCLWN
jgi:hypothetical protein